MKKQGYSLIILYDKGTQDHEIDATLRAMGVDKNVFDSVVRRHRLEQILKIGFMFAVVAVVLYLLNFD